MGKNTDPSEKNGHNTHRSTHPYSKNESPFFFNKGKATPFERPASKKTKSNAPSTQLPETNSPQEVPLTTPTEFLLAGILKQLELHNLMLLEQLNAQQERAQIEQEVTEKMEQKDKERFEEIKYSMYN